VGHHGDILEGHRQTNRRRDEFNLEASMPTGRRCLGLKQ
jgi:hypothetical protein